MIANKIQLIENLLQIDNKDRQTVPFKLNNVQMDFMTKKGSRNIILKARQLGMSTMILADMFIEAITVPNTTCVVISHEQHATERLLEKVHFFYENFPDPQPQMGHGSASEISFPGLHSTIYIGTARSMTFGRGDRIDLCHLSELSRYDDGQRILEAVNEAVPLQGVITIESTPNGEGNSFYQMWQYAREDRSSYTPFFYPWWVSHEYKLPRGSTEALRADRGKLTLDEEERALVSSFKITESQIRWRRRKVSDMDAAAASFSSEYPEDEVTCFQEAGDPVFDPHRLRELAQSCYDGTRHAQGWHFWHGPQEGMRYVIGADCSAGTARGSYSAACVLDDNYVVCATFQAKMEPHQFATLLTALGTFYNMATLAVERNAQGYAVLAKLTDYGDIYLERDFTTGRMTTKPGWWTSEATKAYMMSTFRDMLPRLQTWDVNLVRQAKAYRYIKYKPTAQTYDDLLIACMIAVAVKQVIGVARGFVGNIPGWDW